MEIAFVLSEVRRRPILSCFSLLLLIPPIFRMLLFFFPLLLSTALCVLALVSLGPHLSATANSGTQRGKDIFDGHMHGFPNEDWQPDLENEQETSTLQYKQDKKEQSKWDDQEALRDQWQDGVAEDKAGENVEEAATTGAEKTGAPLECLLEKDKHCPEKTVCSFDGASSCHEISDMIKESPTDEKNACEDKERGDVENQRSAELNASAAVGSKIDDEHSCKKSGSEIDDEHSCKKSGVVAGVDEASQQECQMHAELDGSLRSRRSWDVRRRYSFVRPCSLDCSSSTAHSSHDLLQQDDLSSHDMVRGYETSFDPWESSMWARDFLHEEAINIPVRESVY